MAIGILSFNGAAFAELRLDSVYPTLGQLDQDLEVTLRGQGFGPDTRISMYLDTTNQRMIVGSIDTPGYANNVAVSGSYAYVADEEAGLQVIDISNPSNPKLVASVSTPTYARDVVISGNYAYVADEGGGLQVIDIGDPSQPMAIGSVDTPGIAFGVAVSGSYAYVADWTNGLQIIDISTPSLPVKVGSVDTPGYANDVAVSGIYAYVVDGESGLHVIDISDPSNPWIRGSVDTPDHASDVKVSGTIAYVADWQSGLQVIDVSIPANPQTIGSFDTTGYAYGIEISGTFAYVADYVSGLQVIDISNPAALQIVGSVDTPGNANGVAVSGSLAYVADDWNGLQIIDISAPSIPEIVGFVDTPSYAFGIAVSGSYAYVGDYESGLQVIDISNASSPQIIGSVDTPGHAYGVAVEGSFAYLADDIGGFRTIDISNPYNPQLRGFVATPGDAMRVGVSGNFAYVAEWGEGLRIIDISTPAFPQFVGSVVTPHFAYDVVISGSHAFVADGDSGLQVIDITMPAHPYIIGSVDTPGYALGVAISGNIVYVADLTDGLQVIDIRAPAYPKIIGSVDTPSEAWNVAVLGNYAYLADKDSGVQVIDISTPSSPQIVATLDTPGGAYDVAVANSYAYVADAGAGLAVLPIPVEISNFTVGDETSISATLPSPIDAGHYSLRVFNGSESDELAGAVTFLDTGDYQDLVDKKAIIVAGYRRYPGDSLWAKTRLCANMAYLSLLTQGYRGDNIYYLSPEPVDLDGDGHNDVDADANLQNLSDAIRTWARDANELLLYMTNHGGNGTFQLNETQILDASILDSWLDELQPAVSGKIIVVYDACKSGSFIPLLTPPTGMQRIVISSTAADEYAWFENDGVLSFSYQLWAIIQVNAYLAKAFNTASAMMENDQTALLDANGNGIPNEKADDIADIVIGRGRVAASVPPEVGRVCAKQILNGTTSAGIWADNVIGLNPVTHVWAVIIPPGDRSADDPAINFAQVDLLDVDQDGTYEAVYNDFSEVGSYKVLVYARDEDGAISLPKEIIVSQTAADSYEEDDLFNQAGVIILNNPDSQLHNFHEAGDEDWVKFYGLSGENYTISAYNLGETNDAVIELYAPDGTTLLDSQDTIGDPNADERLDWSCLQDGIYYIKIKHYSDQSFGDGTEYDLKVYRPIATFPGIVSGLVTDTLFGVEIPDVMLCSNARASTLSLSSGDYVMVHPAGTYSVTAQKAGYHPQTIPDVSVNEQEVTTLNFEMVPMPEDTDGDGVPDAVENDSACMDLMDADTDDDGISDGDEFSVGTDPCDIDTDSDGLQDGTELGITTPVADPDGTGPLSGTDTAIFQPDMDTSTTTDPLDADTDDDGWLDGEEDTNHNGKVDPDEKDPNKFNPRCLPHVLPLLLDVQY